MYKVSKQRFELEATYNNGEIFTTNFYKFTTVTTYTLMLLKLHAVPKRADAKYIHEWNRSPGVLISVSQETHGPDDG